MIVNADITIFNKRTANRTHVFAPTVIRGVSFVHTFGRTGGAEEMTSDRYAIRIPGTATTNNRPAFDTYLPQERYRELNDPTGYWTVQKDDIVLLGDSLTDVDAVRSSSYEHCLIADWQDNRSRGSSHVQHIRIGGV